MCGFQGTQKPYTISGDNGERDPPVPIPNTEVKPFSADGTWLETTWESRTLPDSMKKGLTPYGVGSFFIPSATFLLSGRLQSMCDIVLGAEIERALRAVQRDVEEHILCHKGAYMGKNGITRDRTGKLWYYRNLKR